MHGSCLVCFLSWLFHLDASAKYERCVCLAKTQNVPQVESVFIWLKCTIVVSAVWGQPMSERTSLFSLAGFLSLRCYLRHSCRHVCLDPRRCGRRRPWSLADSCMSRCHGYRPSTAGGRHINKHETNKVCKVVCNLPFPCHSRGVGILRCRVYSLVHRNLYSTLQSEEHMHTNWGADPLWFCRSTFEVRLFTLLVMS